MKARLWATLILSAGAVYAQNAELSGLILDPSNANVAGAEVSLRNEQTGGRRTTKSSTAGFYSFASLNPGEYRLTVRCPNFQTMIQDGIRLEVGGLARIDFNLRVGDARTAVTVHGGSPLINTENASVGTVIDRDLIDKMPLNGRGIQSLIELTPGAIVLPVSNSSGGQFAINGQRNNTNYFTVDGVAANFAFAKTLTPTAARNPAQIGSGMVPANNFYGSYSNLVAPESLQEFKIQTSTFTPEYGRSPGGQIELVTRSGTNRYSGSLFEYFRNEKTDANDWFANRQASPKASLRFNNFGGVLGGPIQIPGTYNGRDRTFFFVSVDELLTAQPQPPVSYVVPTLDVRQSAPPLVRQLLDAYPLPNRPAESGTETGFATYAASYSLRQSQYSFSVRLDHTFNEKWTVFARYNRAPSERRTGFVETPTTVGEYSLGTETLTFGLTHLLAPNFINEVRLNASRHSGSLNAVPNTAAGITVPSASLLYPPGYSAKDSLATYQISPAPPAQFGTGGSVEGRQLQAVDNFIFNRGAHLLKFGADYRWYSPVETVVRGQYSFQFPSLYGDYGALGGIIFASVVTINQLPTTALRLEAFSAYAQDTWKAAHRLTLTYGLRWEVAPGPRVSAGQAAVARGVFGEPLQYVPAGTPFYETDWSNIAPRFGLAWQALDRGASKTVVRLGSGIFYDLGQGTIQGQTYKAPMSTVYLGQPVGSLNDALDILSNPPFEFTRLQPRVIAPNYRLPYTWEWNLTVEHSIGQQSFSAAYLGSVGRRLVSWVINPQGTTNLATYIGNDSRSSYNGMQLQFNRRLQSRVRTLISYTWSHSIDDLSSDQTYSLRNGGPTSLHYDPRRKGSSDFDIRHSLNASIIAELPSPRGRIATVLRGWTANSIFFVRTALPTDILADNYVHRPDLVPGQPLYLYGSQFPGGKSFNLGAFTLPAGSEGNFGRNVLRGLGAWQVDLSLQRQFRLSKHASLQLRAEAFNLLNHPNFASPSDFQSPSVLSLPAGYGASTNTLANGLSPLGVQGGLSPLFQIGGPRSMQFAMRLVF